MAFRLRIDRCICERHRFSSDAGVQFGERIVAYLNQIGRVEGRVARIFPGGFAILLRFPINR